MTPDQHPERPPLGGPAHDTGEIDDLERGRRAFAEEFGVFWESEGSPRMEGRVIAYLMITDKPYVSSSELCEVFHASAGSVSVTTRRLADMGFIRRHAIPGDRSHYFRADRDMWGSWLAGERVYLSRQRDILDTGLALLSDSDSPGDAAARERLQNGRDYMIWLASYHTKMLQDWAAYRDARDSATPPHPGLE